MADYAGGYEEETMNYEDHQQSTSEQKSSRYSSKDSQRLIPVTIHQILSIQPGQDDTFKTASGVELAFVSIVGKIKNIDAKHTKTTYTIEDFTGIFSASVFHANANEGNVHFNLHKNEFEIGKYVKVWGTLKNVQEQGIGLVVFRMKVIEDFNELTAHYMEAIYTHLYHTRGPIPKQLFPSDDASANTNATSNQQGMNTSTLYDDQQMTSGYSDLQNAILQHILPYSGEREKGISKLELYNYFKQYNYDETLVDEAIQQLTNDGALFSTVDENHFKVSNAQM